MYNWVPRAERGSTIGTVTEVLSSGMMENQVDYTAEAMAARFGLPGDGKGIGYLSGDSLKVTTPSGWNRSISGIDPSDPDVQAIRNAPRYARPKGMPIPKFAGAKPSNYQNFSSAGKGVKAPFRPHAGNPAMMNKAAGRITPGAHQAKKAFQMLSKAGSAGKLAGAIIAPLAIAGMSAYAMYGSMRGQVEQHDQVNKAFKRTRGALRNGGMTRRQDLESNPIMSFSRPRVRGNNLGATGNLTLSLNNQRTSR